MAEHEMSGVVWKKSSRSGGSGGNCVEIAAVWRKSTRSSGSGGECVEVAAIEPGVAIRDSKHRDGPKLVIGTSRWRAFLADAKRGRFDP